MSGLRCARFRHFFEFKFTFSALLSTQFTFEQNVSIVSAFLGHIAAHFSQFSICQMQYFVFETFSVKRGGGGASNYIIMNYE